MKLVYFFIVLGCLFVSAATEYKAIQNVASWDIIKDRIMLASPEITATEDGPILYIEEDMLDHGEKAWIGYVLDFQVFQYIGCVRESDIEKTGRKVDYEPTDALLGPGFCRSACMNSTVFGLGLNATICECFDTDLADVILTRWNCDEQCGDSGLACGGSGHLSVYKIVDISMDVGSQPFSQRCLLFMYDFGLSWETCDNKYNVLCMTDKGNVSMLVYNETWLGTARRCFHIAIFPLDKKTLKSTTPSKSFWTAYIQTQTFIKLQGNMTVSKHAMVGYVEKKGKGYYLHFTTNKTLTSTALSTKDASKFETTSGPSVRLGDGGNKVIPEASDSVTTNGPAIRRGDDGNKATPVGVYVGTSIGIPLVLAMTVTTLILCKKRLGVNICFWKMENYEYKYNGSGEGDSVNQSSTTRQSGLNHSNAIENNSHNNTTSPNEFRDLNDDQYSSVRNVTGPIVSLTYDDTYAQLEGQHELVVDRIKNLNSLSNKNKSYEKTNEVTVNEIGGANYYTLEKNVQERLDYEDTEGEMNLHFTNVSKDQSEQSDSHLYNRIGVQTTKGNADFYDHIGKKPKVNETGLYDKLPENTEGDLTYDSTTTTNITTNRGNGNDLYSHTTTSNELLGNDEGVNTIYDSTTSSRLTKNRLDEDELYSHTNIDNDEYSTFQPASAGETQNLYGYG